MLSLRPLSRSSLSLANVLSCLGTFTLPAGTRLPNRLAAVEVALALELAQRRSSCAIVSIDSLISPPPPSAPPLCQVQTSTEVPISVPGNRFADLAFDGNHPPNWTPHSLRVCFSIYNAGNDGVLYSTMLDLKVPGAYNNWLAVFQNCCARDSARNVTDLCFTHDPKDPKLPSNNDEWDASGLEGLDVISGDFRPAAADRDLSDLFTLGGLGVVNGRKITFRLRPRGDQIEIVVALVF